jgi:iron complex outermembrane receptor protein
MPRFNAAAEAATGSFSTTRLRGHLNLPGESVGARFAFVASEGDGFIRNALDERRFSEEDYWAARASLRFQARDDLTVDVVMQRAEDDGGSGELWTPRIGFFPDPGDIHLTRVVLADPYHDTTNDFASVNVGWQPGPWTLRSVTGYGRNYTRELDDCDNGMIAFQDCTRGVRPLRYEQFSQEFRVESGADGPLEWLAGLYFADAGEFQRFHNTSPFTSPLPASNYSVDSDERAYALFADATYALGGKWRLNGGVRFSREEHRFDFSGSGFTDGPSPRTGSGSWGAASWRAGLHYAASDRTLLYASVSTGFKSGGLNSRRLPDGSNNDYDPENLVAYEAGVNASLWNGRSVLRASAFFYDFQDMQVRTISTSGGSSMVVVDNAGAARIEGVDLSSITRLTSSLTITGNFVWLPRSEFTEYIDFLGISRAGNRLTRAPELSASASIGYRARLRSLGELGLDVDYDYRTAHYFSKDNIAAEYQGDFGVLNLTLRLDSANEAWYAFASARNLLDEDYFLQALIQTAPGPPARYEVGLGWRW